MKFIRYKPGDSVAKLSAKDINDRADTLERHDRILSGDRPPGVSGGVMFGRITARTVGVASLASAVQYQAESQDGSIRITTNQTPVFRVFDSGTRIVPAAIDSECLLGWYIDVATNRWVERILVAKEVEDPGAC